MSSDSAFAERSEQRVAKSRRFRLSSSTAQTRKRRPPVKKTVQLAKDYIPRDQETEIPTSSYQPLSLPNEPRIQNPTIQYKLTQTETDDTFIATIYKYDDTRLEITVGGSVDMPDCVKINIRKINITNTQTITEANFIVDYNERCNIEKNLKSAVILARIAVSFAFTYFRIDKFILHDQSKFHCKTSARSDYRFHLYGRELLKYGKTWYQRHLNAHIYHPRTLEDIQRYLAFVNTKPCWNVFSQTTHAERLKPYWESSKSYKELVLTLLDEIYRVNPDSKVDEHTNINCHLLYPWFNQVTSHFLQDLPETDNFILRDGFPFVKGLKVEFIPENEVRYDGLTQGGGRRGNGYDGWYDKGFWFTERIR
ncbi:MAG: hypothetical protein FJ333_11075 [Sphingomonadales bacterium]|nr:hypothetical protein [Sphingomonadales bacterium]